MAESFQLELTVRRYGAYPGGTASTGAAMCLLELGFLGLNFGPAIRKVGVELLFRHAGPPPKPFKKADIDRWHTHLRSFPKLKIQPKSKQALVQWATTIDSAVVGPKLKPTVARVAALFQEISSALELLRPRLARVKSFDVDAFMKQLHAVIDAVPRKPTLFSQRVEEAFAAHNERVVREHAQRDPWQALGVDWKKQHPQARRILDEPFFWDCTDDLAPTGNDTGADVLARYSSWHQRNKGKTSGAVEVVERTLREWGMAEDDTASARTTRDEAFVALAFAQIMLAGKTSSDVKSRALAALDRQKASHAGWPNPRARLAALKKLRGALERVGPKIRPVAAATAAATRRRARTRPR